MQINTIMSCYIQFMMSHQVWRWKTKQLISDDIKIVIKCSSPHGGVSVTEINPGLRPPPLKIDSTGQNFSFILIRSCTIYKYVCKECQLCVLKENWNGILYHLPLSQLSQQIVRQFVLNNLKISKYSIEIDTHF